MKTIAINLSNIANITTSSNPTVTNKSTKAPNEARTLDGHELLLVGGGDTAVNVH